MQPAGNSTPEPPITRVPVEILCKIFLKLVGSRPSCLPPSYPDSYHGNLVLSKITTVCRHWREAALDCATLWANIAFSTTLPSTVQCAALFLGRSKGAMLSVCVWDSAHPTGGPAATEASKRLLEDISSQSHRILWCELFSSSPDFWKYWSLPAPGLRKLVVEGCCVETPPVFGGVIPQLQTLTSVNNTPWTLGNYAALRKAELHNYHQHPPFATLLDALEGCRMLEKLTLHGYTQMTQDARGPSTILLPCLRQIDFSSCDSALILEHLDTPSLSGPAVIQDTSPRQHILQSLPSTQRSTPYLEGVTELHVVLEANRAQYYVSGYRDDGRSAFSIVTRGVDHRFRRTWVLSSIEAVASSSHFSEVRALKLVTDGAVVPWKMWLRKLRHIRNLSVSCLKSEDLFTALLTTPEDGLPLCPSLRTLAISRCDRCANVDPSSLLELVLHRHWTGRPLRRLALHQDDWEFIRQLDMDNAWDCLTELLSHYGDNVILELLLDVDFGEIWDRLCIYQGRPSLIDWPFSPLRRSSGNVLYHGARGGKSSGKPTSLESSMMSTGVRKAKL